MGRLYILLLNLPVGKKKKEPKVQLLKETLASLLLKTKIYRGKSLLPRGLDLPGPLERIWGRGG